MSQRGMSPSIMAPLLSSRPSSGWPWSQTTKATSSKHRGDSSSSELDTSDDDDDKSARSNEKFATDRFNGQSLPMKLQMNTNLSQLFNDFALSRFLRNNGDPDLLGFVLDHKLAPLEKTQFVAGVKAF